MGSVSKGNSQQERKHHQPSVIAVQAPQSTANCSHDLPEVPGPLSFTFRPIPNPIPNAQFYPQTDIYVHVVKISPSFAQCTPCVLSEEPRTSYPGARAPPGTTSHALPLTFYQRANTHMSARATHKENLTHTHHTHSYTYL